MKRLYVACQNSDTREWIPVAELLGLDGGGYELRYTNGAHRLAGFGGFGRMQSLDKTYYSNSLFPFFANRVLSKSRPEYKSYLRWLGVDGVSNDPMDILSITGGVRATDSYELIGSPKLVNNRFELGFFPRGLRYQSSSSMSELISQTEGNSVCMMRDIQNKKDPQAIALRTDTPYASFLGYLPRYYCNGVSRLLEDPNATVCATIKRVNSDAPLDMKILVQISAVVSEDFNLFQGVDDFQTLTSERAERLSEKALHKTDLDL